MCGPMPDQRNSPIRLPALAAVPAALLLPVVSEQRVGILKPAAQRHTVRGIEVFGDDGALFDRIAK